MREQTCSSFTLNASFVTGMLIRKGALAKKWHSTQSTYKQEGAYWDDCTKSNHYGSMVTSLAPQE